MTLKIKQSFLVENTEIKNSLFEATLGGTIL